MALEDQIAALATATTELTDQALVTLGESAANADRAELARDFSTQEANRATAAQSAITTELAQVQALAEQVASDKAGVTATLIGSENYIIPAVTQLLSTYPNVVATAISDDVWAEHSHKWGAPKQVLFVAQETKLIVFDATKPTLPVYITMDAAGTYSQKITGGNYLFSDRAVALSTCGSFVFIGVKHSAQNYMGGCMQYDFATDKGAWHRRLTNNANGLDIINSWVNSIATRIADHAPRHPVSGLPMPTIAVATDGGDSELVPTDDGKWTVRSWSDTEPHGAISYTPEGRLLSSKISGGITYDLSAITAGTALTTANRTYGLASGSTLRNLDGGTTVNSTASKQFVKRGLNGLSMFRENPSNKAAGMVAFASIGYSTPYLVGDVQGAWLCGSEEGVVSGGELVTNGDFSNGLTGWTGARGVETISVNSGTLHVASTTNSTAFGVSAPVTGLVVGATYQLSATKLSSDAPQSYIRVGVQADIASNLAYNGSNGLYSAATFVATATTMYVGFVAVPTAVGQYIEIDNVSIKRVAPDYSGRNNHAIIHGSLTRTKPVGSDIAVWSGFLIGVNAIEIPNSQGWFNPLEDWAFTIYTNASGDLYIGQYGKDGSWNTYDKTGVRILNSGPSGTKQIALRYYDSATSSPSGRQVTTAWDESSAWKCITATKQGNKVTLWLNGIAVSSNTSSSWTTVTTQAFGNLFINYVVSGAIAAVSYTKTVPSDDQIREMHRDMLNKLSKPSVLSGNVKALAYDPIRKQDWVACDSKKLHRLDGTCIVETVTVDTNIGTISSLTVNDGLITVGGTGGTWVKQPEKNLRAPQVRAGKSVRTFELGEGNGTKVDFYLPRGWKPERAYVDGIKKRKGAQDDWTAQFDGYKWFVRFAVAPGAVDVDVDAVEV